MFRHSVIRSSKILLALLSVTALTAGPARAFWPTDPALNVPVCTNPTISEAPQIVTDGSGGAIIVWGNAVSSHGIRIQRLSASGEAMWTPNGVALTSGTSNAAVPVICSDGQGGAIVAWDDARVIPRAVYAQRVDASGVPQWTADGVKVGDNLYPTDGNIRIVSDQAHGALVAWQSQLTIASPVVLNAQRLDAAGAAQWAAGGNAISSTSGGRLNANMASDGAGGEIIVWQQSFNIKAQRLSMSGIKLWPASGVSICTDPDVQLKPVLVADGAGGGVVAWQDDRNIQPDIYAQRVNASGVVLWTLDGVNVSHVPPGLGGFSSFAIAPDATGGAFFAWDDFRDSSSSFDVIAQRVDGSGALTWAAGGLAVCDEPLDDGGAVLVPDGSGGVIVAWQGYGSDLYAQRFTAAGSPMWANNGVAVSTAAGAQIFPALTDDGGSGAILAWHDRRSNERIYAQRFDLYGQLGGVAPLGTPEPAPLSFALEPIRPNPYRGGELLVHFALADHGPATIELMDIAGRRIAARQVGQAGPGRHSVTLDEGLNLAPGVYMVRLRQGRETRVAPLVSLGH